MDCEQIEMQAVVPLYQVIFFYRERKREA